MKNFEVFIIVAVIAGLGYYWYKNRATTTTAVPASVTMKGASGGTCNLGNLFPCKSFSCGMISRVVTCCGQVV